jgi:hypothetical protein
MARKPRVEFRGATYRIFRNLFFPKRTRTESVAAKAEITFRNLTLPAALRHVIKKEVL